MATTANAFALDHIGTSADVADLYSEYQFLQQKPRLGRWQQLRRRAVGLKRRLSRRRSELAYVRDPAPHLNLDAVFAHFEVRAKRCQVLDAGCGGGWVSAHLARLHPQHEVLGVDLVPAHIASCEAAYGNLPNLSFRQADIATLADVLGGRQFDVIVSTGVLHHMPDPAAGLKALRQVLAPEGLVLLYLYDAYARHPAHLLRRAVYMVGADASPPQRLELARGFLQAVAGTDRFAQLHREELALQADAVLADTFTHPVEYTYSLAEANALLAGEGLEVVGFFDFHRQREGKDPLLDHRYFLERLLEPVAARHRALLRESIEALPELERVHLLSLLCDRHTFRGLTLVCGAEGIHPPRLW